MGYRPSISKNVDKRATLFNLERDGSKNEIYEQAVKLMLDEDGNEKDLSKIMTDEDGEYEEWFLVLREYVQETDQEMSEVLNQIITSVLDSDGEANVQFKEKLSLK